MIGDNIHFARKKGSTHLVNHSQCCCILEETQAVETEKQLRLDMC